MHSTITKEKKLLFLVTRLSTVIIELKTNTHEPNNNITKIVIAILELPIIPNKKSYIGVVGYS